jgi:hypothetical protein
MKFDLVFSRAGASAILAADERGLVSGRAGRHCPPSCAADERGNAVAGLLVVDVAIAPVTHSALVRFAPVGLLADEARTEGRQQGGHRAL